MKLNITQKCQLVGALFLLVVTGIEITTLLYVLDLRLFGRESIGIFGTAIVFNVTVWYFATKYQTTKEYLEKEWNEYTDK